MPLLVHEGCTTADTLVVSGIYRLYETHGMPLDILLGLLRTQGIIPCWISFVREAVCAGMKRDRILAKLDEALSDVYSSAFRDAVMQRLRQLP